MKLKPIGSNQTQLTTSNHIILFSYATPVAFEVKRTGLCYRTSKSWSRTTSKHINRWLDGRRCGEVSQEQIDSLASA